MTIEERATEIFENYPHPYEMPYDDNAYFDGEQVVDMMVKIATEQKAIDVAKAKRLVSVMLDKIEQFGINGDKEKEIWIKNFTKAIEQW